MNILAVDARKILILMFLGLTGLCMASVALGGTVKKLTKDKDKAVLVFGRKVVRDLYEADIISIRMIESNAVVNVAVLMKQAKQVLVAVLPQQNLEGLEEDAEFVLVEDNRVPSHNIWARDPGDIQLSDSSLLSSELLLGYRSVTVDDRSLSTETGIGAQVSGLYRSFDYGGFGVDFDMFSSNINYAEAKQKGKFSHRRTRFYGNVTAGERVSVGGDLILQTARRDILNSTSERRTLSTDYSSNHFGLALNYRGYNYNWGLRFRPRGTLQMRTESESGNGKETDPYHLSTQYGLDYWKNNERDSAYYFRLTYFKFENFHGNMKPSLFESINFSAGFENFINAQQSIALEIEKLAPFTPDQFGILRSTSTFNVNMGFNNTFAKDYHLLTGLTGAYGADNQDFVEGEIIEEKPISEVYFGVMVRMEYRLW